MTTTVPTPHSPGTAPSAAPTTPTEAAARPVAGRVRRALAVLRHRAASDHGDVPGWVLITLVNAA